MDMTWQKFWPIFIGEITLVLWVGLQMTFAAAMLRSHLRARRHGQDWRKRIFARILAYWTAFLVDAAFLMGFGAAAAIAHRCAPVPLVEGMVESKERSDAKEGSLAPA